MSKSNKKQLTIKLNFVDDLVEKDSAYGLYYRLSPKSNTVHIYIDSKQNQLSAINTLYHEFTHFIIDLMTNSRNFKKFMQYRPKESSNVVQIHGEVTPEQEDENEEKFCYKLAKSCEKKVKKYLES